MLPAIFILPTILLAIVVVLVLAAMYFRTVVETNEVHIVQSARKTQSFGKDTGNGNVYYNFPGWVPILGVSKIILPVSVFSIKIEAYEAYTMWAGYHLSWISRRFFALLIQI